MRGGSRVAARRRPADHEGMGVPTSSTVVPAPHDTVRELARWSAGSCRAGGPVPARDGSDVARQLLRRAMPSRLVSSMALSYAATRLATESGLSRSTTWRTRSGDVPDSW